MLPSMRRVTLTIPARLVATCEEEPERMVWLEQLPDAVAAVRDAWSLELGEPFEHEGCASWVAPVTRADGTRAVLKLGVPHMEAEHEIDGLRFWDGDPTVRLLELDRERNALLLERCEPGTTLRELPEPEQDVVLAGLLRRLWRVAGRAAPVPAAGRDDRVLARRDARRGRALGGRGLVCEGLRLFEELPRTANEHVLLATDLHAGNVLRAGARAVARDRPEAVRRRPGLRRDAAPRQLRRACAPIRSRRSHRFADLLGLDRERVRLWTFARAAAEWWLFDDLAPVARALAP